jgi:hypothetical protein
MNARDKTAHMMQASAGNSWGTEAHFQAFADLIRADAMETANRAATASWTLMCKKMVEFERDGCIYAAEIALLGTDKALSDRVIKAIRARGNT